MYLRKRIGFVSSSAVNIQQHKSNVRDWPELTVLHIPILGSTGWEVVVSIVSPETLVVAQMAVMGTRLGTCAHSHIGSCYYLNVIPLRLWLVYVSSTP
jgi:hypothetical protein